MKTGNILSIRTLSFMLILLVSACRKEDTVNCGAALSPEFTGAVECIQEVDLGLSVKWSGYNVGADCPEGHGAYFSWSETASKDSYFENNHSKYDKGQILLKENDAAKAAFGHGWHIPSPADVKELIDSCDVRQASYKGTNGWVVTSRVKGFEGRSIFFPASGYAAGENINYKGELALFWTNTLVDGTDAHAINGYFKGDALCINRPPQGAGGLVWCGYPVRPVRSFSFGISPEEGTYDVTSDETGFSFSISGNSYWKVELTGEGITADRTSGEDDAEVRVSFPVNHTENFKYYEIKVSSEDLSISRTIKLRHFGLTPTFRIAGEPSSQIGWNVTSAECDIEVNPSVRWNASVKLNGEAVAGASVTPASGMGSAKLSITVPKSTQVAKTTEYTVEIISDDERIPEISSKLEFKVIQDWCHTGAPYGAEWGEDYIKAIYEYFGEPLSNQGYLTPGNCDVHNMHIEGQVKLENTKGESWRIMTRKMPFSFVVAEDGDAIIHAKFRLAPHKSYDTSIKFSKNGTVFDNVTFLYPKNSSGTNLTLEDDIIVKGLKAGDVISFVGTYSGDHRFYFLSFDKYVEE